MPLVNKVASFLLLVLVLHGCTSAEVTRVLPEPAEATSWFGPSMEARISGNMLELRGTMEEDHLRRGGTLWGRSGPYFYLFNVHVQRLFQEYPDLAAVRAIALDDAGEEVARATLHRAGLSAYQWREALARASRAQTEGTESPRRVEELVYYGQEHTEYEYAR